MGLWEDLDCGDVDTNLVHRGIARVVATRAGARVASRALPPIDSAVRRLSRGRTTATEALAALPTITLVTTGARTGRPRHTHLLAIPHGGEIAVIGSNYGQAPTPGWVHNLRANPEVEIEHAGLVASVVARPLVDAEADQVWARGRSMYAGYAFYRERAAHREITVWLLVARGNAGTAS
jgi:deazaflavin-dependent oxidoreductase (nitroreductase family)